MTIALVGVFGVMMVLFALISPLYFASKQANYSAIRHTLSELGELGSKHQHGVAFGYFLPLGISLGIYTIAVLYFVSPNVPWLAESRLPLSLFGWVSIGYIIAALFPCDQGAPMKGSTRNKIHNVAGLLEYLGAGSGMLLVGLILLAAPVAQWAVYVIASGVFVLCMAVIMLFPLLLPFRGLIQRAAELAFFSWVLIFSVYLLFL